MKLYFNAASPFVRKVRLLVREAGLESKVEEVTTAVTPLKPNAELARDNPLMKIPALVTDDGFALFDSPVICEYLDSLNAGRKLFPAAGPARWSALRQQAVADGILDAGILVRYQLAFCPKELHWQEWMDGQRAKWHQGLDFLEQDVAALAGEPTIGSLAVAAALGWLDFRYGDDNWRGSRPKLAAWFAAFSGRASMQATMPKA
jgi:glutathione S-transferase